MLLGVGVLQVCISPYCYPQRGFGAEEHVPSCESLRNAAAQTFGQTPRNPPLTYYGEAVLSKDPG